MVPELWPLKVKSRGVRLFKQAHFFGTLQYEVGMGWSAFLTLHLLKQRTEVKRDKYLPFIAR